MGFLDELSLGLDRLGKSIEEFGEDSLRAAKEFSQIQKLKSEAAEARSNVNLQYLRLGKRFYEEHREDPEMAADPMFRTIDENLKKAADCDAEVRRLKEASEAARAASGEAAAARAAAREAEELERQERGMDPEVLKANAEDDIVDYQPARPADDSDFEEE